MASDLIASRRNNTKEFKKFKQYILKFLVYN